MLGPGPAAAPGPVPGEAPVLGPGPAAAPGPGPAEGPGAAADRGRRPGPDRPLPGEPTTPGLPDLSHAWPVVAAAARVLIPSTLLASLFFYFGQRYTEDHFMQYGVDDAGLGFSTTDYAVRSLNVTVEPARAVATGVIVAVAVHVVLAAALHRADRTRPGSGRRAARLLGTSLAAAGAVGLVLFWSPGRPGVAPVTSAGWWFVSLLTAMYGACMAWARWPAPAGTRGSGELLGPTERRVVTSVVLAMALVLVAHGAFELTRAYARDRAVRQSMRTEAAPWAYPMVRVYSTADLALDDELGIPEDTLAGDEGAYRYRYSDMRLFLHHHDRLVLWPADRSPRQGMFILREDDGLRVEYIPELR